MTRNFEATTLGSVDAKSHIIHYSWGIYKHKCLVLSYDILCTKSIMNTMQ